MGHFGSSLADPFAAARANRPVQAQRQEQIWLQR
jgi:hypothetical protein